MLQQILRESKLRDESLIPDRRACNISGHCGLWNNIGMSWYNGESSKETAVKQGSIHPSGGVLSSRPCSSPWCIILNTKHNNVSIITILTASVV
jgi:hypothetical protein